MTNLIQTPVPIGPIPVDVILVPETADTLLLTIIAIGMFFVLSELNEISKNTRRKP